LSEQTLVGDSQQLDYQRTVAEGSAIGAGVSQTLSQTHQAQDSHLAPEENHPASPENQNSQEQLATSND